MDSREVNESPGFAALIHGADGRRKRTLESANVRTFFFLRPVDRSPKNKKRGILKPLKNKAFRKVAFFLKFETSAARPQDKKRAEPT